MTAPITPIETHYAGCRFRSRLEARWAVFFDHAGIPWEYEPQGFMIDGKPYLPDFYLPDCGTWVEVKGSSQDLDRDLLDKAALQLPHLPHRGECGPRLMILGPIPDPGHEGDIGWLGFGPDDEGGSGWPWGFGYYHKNSRPWVLMSAEPLMSTNDSPSELFAPWVETEEGGNPRVLAAYRAARSARFEHGEKG